MMLISMRMRIKEQKNNKIVVMLVAKMIVMIMTFQSNLKVYLDLEMLSVALNEVLAH